MLILYGRAIEETLITSTAYKSIGLKKIKYKTLFIGATARVLQENQIRGVGTAERCFYAIPQL